MNDTRRYGLVAAACAVVAGALPADASPRGSPDVIIEWNDIAQRNNAGQPFPQMRIYAALHVAMADAVIAIEGRYRPWHARVRAPAGASADAAAAQAARDVLAAFLPLGTAEYDAALAARLQDIAPAQRAKGVEVGRAVAAKIIAWRQNDGYAAANPQPPPFLASQLPGIWKQTGLPAQFSQIGIVLPFGIASPTQFLPVPPPQLESAEYANDLNDVKAVGRADSATRTAEQTALAQSIAGSGPFANVTNPLRIWLNVIRDLALDSDLSLVESARLFALATGSMHDSLLTAHTSKFVYRLWRPETAVPNAHLDDNPATDADPAFVPLLATPPYPSHSSNASCIAVGAARMMANFFGTDAKSFTAAWYTAGPNPSVVFSKDYDSLWAFAEDKGSSRVWGGIHYRFEIDASEDACTQVADYLFDRYLRPRPNRRH